MNRAMSRNRGNVLAETSDLNRLQRNHSGTAENIQVFQVKGEGKRGLEVSEERASDHLVGGAIFRAESGDENIGVDHSFHDGYAHDTDTVLNSKHRNSATIRLLERQENDRRLPETLSDDECAGKGKAGSMPM